MSDEHEHWRWLTIGPKEELYCDRCKVFMKVVPLATVAIVDQLQAALATERATVDGLAAALQEIVDLPRGHGDDAIMVGIARDALDAPYRQNAPTGHQDARQPF